MILRRSASYFAVLAGVLTATPSTAQSVYGEYQYFLSIARQVYQTDTINVDARLNVASGILKGQSYVCSDVVCCVGLYRTGGIGSFVVNQDYYDIYGDDEANQVMDKSKVPYDVKIVDHIYNVNGSVGEAGGVTDPGSRNTIIEASVVPNAWAHEFGHMQGIHGEDDSCDGLVMNTYAGIDKVAVTDYQCSNYFKSSPDRSGPIVCSPITAIGTTFVASGGPSKVTLTWEEGEPGSSPIYSLYRSDSCWGPDSLIASIQANDPAFTSDSTHYTYVDNGAVYLREYIYTIRTAMEAVTARATPTSGVYPSTIGNPGHLSGIGYIPLGGRPFVSLTWVPAAGIVSGYHVYRAKYGGMDSCSVPNLEYLGTSSTASFSDTTAPGTGIPISYRVRAFNSTQGGEVSNEAVVARTPVTFRIFTNPSGATIYDNGLSVMVGSAGYAPPCSTFSLSATRALSVPGTQTIAGNHYCFASWSDGGRRTHTLVINNDSTITLHLMPIGSGPTAVSASATLYDDAYDCASPYVFQGPATLTTSDPTDTFRVWGNVSFRAAKNTIPLAYLRIDSPLRATGTRFETSDTTATGGTALWDGIKLNTNGAVLLDSCTVRNATKGIWNYGAALVPTISVRHTAFDYDRDDDVILTLDPGRNPTATFVGNTFGNGNGLQLGTIGTSLSPSATATITDNFFYTSSANGSLNLTGGWQGEVDRNTFTINQSNSWGVRLNEYLSYASPTVNFANNFFNIVAVSGRMALWAPPKEGSLTQINAANNNWSYDTRDQIEAIIRHGLDSGYSNLAVVAFEPWTSPPLGGGGGGGGGGCPFVLSPAEHGFVIENSVLGRSEMVGSAVEDAYPLHYASIDSNARLRLRVAELETETDRIDQIRLGAVVVPDGYEVGTDPDGKPVLFRRTDVQFQELARNGKVTASISPLFPGQSYRGEPGDSVDFAVSNGTGVKHRRVAINMIPKPTAAPIPGGPTGVTLRVSPDLNGDRWVTLDAVVPRENWSLQTFPTDALDGQPIQRVRVIWHSIHTLGWIGVVDAVNAPVQDLPCLAATHSGGLSVLSALREVDGVCAGLSPQEYIDLEFDTRGAPPGSQLVFMAHGQYFRQGANPAPEVPAVYFLEQNRPNPFNPSTTIQFGLPKGSRTTLRVFDVNGRLVRTLVDRSLPAGLHSAEWDGRNFHAIEVGSGIYFYELRAGSFIDRRRMALIR